MAQNPPFSADKWELYHVEQDYAEIHDLADQYPEKVQDLQELWWAEAGRYNVLPLDDRKAERFLLVLPFFPPRGREAQCTLGGMLWLVSINELFKWI